MSYDEEQTKRSRVVVETPNERREVVQHQTVRYPEERRGFSTGMVVTVALLAIAATAIIFLFLTNSRDDSSQVNVNLRASTQPTPMTQAPVVVTQPPVQPTPIIITQPAPVTQTQPAPVIIQAPPPATTTAPPASTGSTGSSSSAATDDSVLQQRIDKALEDDTDLKAAGVTATVIGGRVSLTGTVNTDALKRKAERLVTIKGVTGVDNHIAVTPSP